jgi:hypothetical protein
MGPFLCAYLSSFADRAKQTAHLLRGHHMSRQQEQRQPRFGAPPALLAIVQAARRELAEQHGIELVFRRERRAGVSNAN